MFSWPFSPKIVFGFLVLSFLGLADAGYLAIAHLENASPKCFLASGCDIVTTSSYAVILGVPVALVGAIYYLAVFLLSIAFLDTQKLAFLKIAAILTFGGFAVSLVFVGIQLFVLDAICTYCMVSAGTSTFLAALGLSALRFHSA